MLCLYDSCDNILWHTYTKLLDAPNLDKQRMPDDNINANYNELDTKHDDNDKTDDDDDDNNNDDNNNDRDDIHGYDDDNDEDDDDDDNE